MRRRDMLALPWVLSPAMRAVAASSPLQIGLTPVFLHDSTRFLGRWRQYLQMRMQREIQFVMRGSYREIVDMVRNEKIDVAWLCGYPYLRYAAEMRLLCAPSYQGAPLYQSFLIVSAEDAQTRGWQDLKGKVFAYSDPDSNSGYLYPRHALRQLGLDPEQHFARTFFTWAHRKVVEAVASGLAQAGAVDGYVWNALARRQPQLVQQTKVILRSPPFGFPPWVSRRNLPQGVFAGMQQALFSMRDDAEGLLLLKELDLDGFTLVKPDLYAEIASMMQLARRAS